MTRTGATLARLSATLVAMALVAALAVDLGLIWLETARTAALARIAARFALAGLPQSASHDQEQRHAVNAVRAVLFANGQGAGDWSVSLVRAGTGASPSLTAIVRLERPVATYLIGALSPTTSRAGAVVSVDAPVRSRSHQG
jgi:hypothetical protein